MSPHEPLHDGACLQARRGPAPCFLGAGITGQLRGLLFEASVEQRFCNPSQESIELVYRFPLPWGAVLLGVDVLLGDKRLSGAVAEKTRAEARYEDALSEGDAAILLVRHSDHSHSLNLGNLAAGEACTITLRYAQTLSFEQGGLRLLIPTVIAPRYGDPVQGGGLAPHSVVPPSLLAEHPFSLSLQLHGPLARARLASPSHPVQVAHGQGAEGDCVSVSLARQSALDRDFVLVLDQLADQPIAVAARDERCGNAVAVLTGFCPRLPAAADAPVAVKMLVDCSGSMAGDSIDAARRALRAITGLLRTGDRFALSRFGSGVEHRARGLWRATEVSRLAARRWVDGLQADMGGTEMEAALQSTFALAQQAPSDVLLVTDGEIEAIDATIASARQSGHRVFVVGIGSSPAEAHLRRLAQATGGACDFVAPGEAVEPAMLRMFARLRSPQLAEPRLQWPQGVRVLWQSPLPSALFDGDSVHVLALLDGAPAGTASLWGRAPGASAQAIAEVRLNLATQGADTLARMVAASRIHATPDPAEATQLAVDYQLVTEHTHFVLVHERAADAKALDMPALHPVRPMLAAGWGGTGSVNALASATPSLAGITVPAVWRSKRTSAAARVDALAAGSLDDLQIPAFLRKAAAPLFAPPKRPARIQRTPAQLMDWLRATPPAQWPCSYDGLLQIGVPRAQVDELRRIAAADHAAQATVVQAFLLLLAQPELRDALADTEAMCAAFDAALARAPAWLGLDAPAATPAWLQELAASLIDLSADAWPWLGQYAGEPA
ncbi:MAG: VWA domain-containing protein [Proteobacteria bacterium]|nr:VWA domain-containing protein [Pseudomonadota bacterium]